MQIKDVQYVFDLSNGEFVIRLSDNEIIYEARYNQGNVTIGTDKNNDIVLITIHGFREYIGGLIDSYLKKAIMPLMR